MSAQNDPRAELLSGVRVLDLSRLLPGPFATKLLADMGAQVDKIEDPGAGDYLRQMPPRPKDGHNRAFAFLNGGKRSAVLDLKSQVGREALLRILPSYDVLLESFRPGVMARLGLGPDVLFERHPSLVLCSISAYGQAGPLADRPGHDLNCVARSGVLALSGPADGAPQTPPMQLADTASGLYAALTIVAALRRGKAVHLDISMAEAAASFGVFGFATATAPRGADVLTGGLAIYRCYETSDGKYMSLACLEEKFWRAFCDATGTAFRKEALIPGPHQPALVDEFRALFRTQTQAEWTAVGEQAACCLEPVLTPSELLSDPQSRFRNTYDGERLSTPAAPASPRPAPAQGEHTDEIVPG
ncbi:MAG: CaiB/BaiF CoA-transferase family protein [Myxococcota bacterium]